MQQYQQSTINNHHLTQHTQQQQHNNNNTTTTQQQHNNTTTTQQQHNNNTTTTQAIFTGATINTPSMLAVEDYIAALSWADSVGGVPGLISRSEANLSVLTSFVSSNPWIDFLAKEEDIRSSTSVCLTLDLTAKEIKTFCGLLEEKGAALDIGGYRDAPPSIRIWCGSTVEKEDVEKLMPWLTWAYETVVEGRE